MTKLEQAAQKLVDALDEAGCLFLGEVHDKSDQAKEIIVKALEAYGAKVPRMNPKGQGAHYAPEIKRLGKTRVMLLAIMRENVAVEEGRTMTSKELGNLVRKRIIKKDQELDAQITAAGGKYTRHVTLPTDHSLGGRMSELVGLKLVAMSNVKTQNEDYDEVKWRTKPEPRFYLTERGQTCPLLSSWDPREAEST